MNAKPLCIYHHACSDGFAAAWVVRKFFGDGNVDFHPGIYGEAPPDVTGRTVILVDFSYKRDVLLALSEQAESVLILDHHKTAQDDLVDLPANVRTEFDMDRSGAMITWDVFFPDQNRPLLFDYIQDRDLWQFKLPSTRAVTAALYSYPFDFIIWDVFIEAGVRGLINDGLAINRKQRTDVDAIVRDATRWVFFGATAVPVANVPWMYASDVGGELAIGVPFAGTYYDDAEGRRWSLRSSPDGADVSAIAQAFGGGGHQHAAGFRMTREEAIDFDLAGGIGV
ncbi:MAG: hypothetical protein ABTQ26_00340 [Azonexus sp.]